MSVGQNRRFRLCNSAHDGEDVPLVGGRDSCVDGPGNVVRLMVGVDPEGRLQREDRHLECGDYCL
jgi:hypothetical protein